MAGTKRGGRKAAKTNKERYGESFYEGIGRTGGATRTEKTALKGFGSKSYEYTRECGRKGGKALRHRKYDFAIT